MIYTGGEHPRRVKNIHIYSRDVHKMVNFWYENELF